jgi:hypothetical protein
MLAVITRPLPREEEIRIIRPRKVRTGREDEDEVAAVATVAGAVGVAVAGDEPPPPEAAGKKSKEERRRATTVAGLGTLLVIVPTTAWKVMTDRSSTRRELGTVAASTAGVWGTSPPIAPSPRETRVVTTVARMVTSLVTARTLGLRSSLPSPESGRGVGFDSNVIYPLYVSVILLHD